MKHLKFIHILIGLLGLVVLVIDGQTTEAVLSQSMQIPTPALLLLMATLVHLALGSYLSVFRCKMKVIQLLAALSLVSATALSSVALYSEAIVTMPVVMMLIIVGVLLHVATNLKSFNPVAPVDYEDSNREMGTVKWFNVTKGFGFITRDQGDDVFVHYRAIRGEGHRTLSEGQRVEFIVVDKDKGLQAEDVIAAKKGR